MLVLEDNDSIHCFVTKDCKCVVLISFLFMQVFSTFKDLGISVIGVATSEFNISLTLDPSKPWSRELIQPTSSIQYAFFQSFLKFDLQEDT